MARPFGTALDTAQKRPTGKSRKQKEQDLDFVNNHVRSVKRDFKNGGTTGLIGFDAKPRVKKSSAHPMKDYNKDELKSKNLRPEIKARNNQSKSKPSSSRESLYDKAFGNKAKKKQASKIK